MFTLPKEQPVKRLLFWWVKTGRADNNQSDWRYQHMEENREVEVSETVKADTSIRSAEDNSGLSAGLVPNKTDATKVVGNTDSAKGQTEETDRQVSNKSSLEDINKADQDRKVTYDQSDVTTKAEDINKDSLQDTSNKGNSLEDSNTSLEDNTTDKASVSGKEDKADYGKSIESVDINNSADNTAEDNNNNDNTKEPCNKKLTNIEIYRQGLNKEEQRELARQAGIRSGEARRERRTLGEHLKALLSVGNTQEDICLALIGAAKTGNYKAFNSIRDTIGEMPTQKQEVTASITDGDKALLEKVSRRLDCSSGTDKKAD